MLWRLKLRALRGDQEAVRRLESSCESWEGHAERLAQKSRLFQTCGLNSSGAEKNSRRFARKATGLDWFLAFCRR